QVKRRVQEAEPEGAIRSGSRNDQVTGAVVDAGAVLGAEAAGNVLGIDPPAVGSIPDLVNRVPGRRDRTVHANVEVSLDRLLLGGLSLAADEVGHFVVRQAFELNPIHSSLEGAGLP